MLTRRALIGALAAGTLLAQASAAVGQATLVTGGIMPFLAADLVRLGLLTAFPALTLWTLRLWKGQ